MTQSVRAKITQAGCDLQCFVGVPQGQMCDEIRIEWSSDICTVIFFHSKNVLKVFKTCKFCSDFMLLSNADSQVVSNYKTTRA